MILTSSSGSTFPELMSELLWKPIGAKTEASITLDHCQDVRTAGGISVTIDDLTTMGQVICDGGKSSQGNQILPEAWINEIIDSAEETVKLGSSENLYRYCRKGSYHNKWVAIGKFRSSHLCFGNPWTIPLYQSSSKFGNFLFFLTADTVGHGLSKWKQSDSFDMIASNFS